MAHTFGIAGCCRGLIGGERPPSRCVALPCIVDWRTRRRENDEWYEKLRAGRIITTHYRQSARYVIVWRRESQALEAVGSKASTRSRRLQHAKAAAQLKYFRPQPVEMVEGVSRLYSTYLQRSLGTARLLPLDVV